MTSWSLRSTCTTDCVIAQTGVPAIRVYICASLTLDAETGLVVDLVDMGLATRGRSHALLQLSKLQCALCLSCRVGRAVYISKAFIVALGTHDHFRFNDGTQSYRYTPLVLKGHDARRLVGVLLRTGAVRRHGGTPSLVGSLQQGELHLVITLCAARRYVLCAYGF